METKYCSICNKEMVYLTFNGYRYKKVIGNKHLYACSWTCFNKITKPNKRVEREKRMIEQELNGELKISNNYVAKSQRTMNEIKADAKESKEIAEKRREIERELRKRNKLAVYWSRNNSTHNNSKTT